MTSTQLQTERLVLRQWHDDDLGTSPSSTPIPR